MAGPCSMPVGSKAEWSRLNETVCDRHMIGGEFHCTPGYPAGNKDAQHVWVTLRVWLAKRNRLSTGKTSRA